MPKLDIDFRIKACLMFAAFLLGSAYLAIWKHVLIAKTHFPEVSARAGIVIGSMEAVIAIPVLWYAWIIHRRNVSARKGKPGTSN